MTTSTPEGAGFLRKALLMQRTFDAFIPRPQKVGVVLSALLIIHCSVVVAMDRERLRKEIPLLLQREDDLSDRVTLSIQINGEDGVDEAIHISLSSRKIKRVLLPKKCGVVVSGPLNRLCYRIDIHDSGSSGVPLKIKVKPCALYGARVFVLERDEQERQRAWCPYTAGAPYPCGVP